MNLRLILITSLANLLGCFAHSEILYAKELKALTVNWEPYYGEKLKDGGPITVIVKEAFKLVGFDFSVKFVPWKRALSEVKNGNADIVLGAYYNEERAKIYHVSDPFYKIDVGLVARKDADITSYKKLQDLSKYKIGISNGWMNSKEFDEAEYLNKIGSKDQIYNMKKLFAGRVHMIAIAFDIFTYEAGKAKYDLKDVVFLKPKLTVNELILLGSKKKPQMKKIMADFNSGLKKLKENGRFKEILGEFNFKPKSEGTAHRVIERIEQIQYKVLSRKP